MVQEIYIISEMTDIPFEDVFVMNFIYEMFTLSVNSSK